MTHREEAAENYAEGWSPEQYQLAIKKGFLAGYDEGYRAGIQDAASICAERGMETSRDAYQMACIHCEKHIRALLPKEKNNG